ncbi:MAG: SMP-30/gluconolactonase/LRE family protein [Myxococcota bacterium]
MVAFEPQTWRPAAAPALDGALRANSRLAQARLVPVGAEGPEDVVVDAEGVAFTGTADGRLLAIDRQGHITTVARPGGRPLGLEWYGDDLVLCNTALGLQLVSRSGKVKTLADAFEGTRFRFTNNASVATDGTIYFSDTSQRWGIEQYVSDLLEGQDTGRVFARAPSGGLTKVTDGLQFANGVALDATEASLFVAETGRYRVHRVYLKGERAGQTEVFAENLPGFPDNLTFGGGILWVSLASPRQNIVDLMHPRPWLRHVSHRLPEALKPKPLRHGIVLGYDAASGDLVHNLQDTSGRVAITTSARYHEGHLYIGSLSEPHLAVYPLD